MQQKYWHQGNNSYWVSYTGEVWGNCHFCGASKRLLLFKSDAELSAHKELERRKVVEVLKEMAICYGSLYAILGVISHFVMHASLVKFTFAFAFLVVAHIAACWAILHQEKRDRENREKCKKCNK